jgi:hypothetical protein
MEFTYFDTILRHSIKKFRSKFVVLLLIQKTITFIKQIIFK